MQLECGIDCSKKRYADNRDAGHHILGIIGWQSYAATNIFVDQGKICVQSYQESNKGCAFLMRLFVDPDVFNLIYGIWCLIFLTLQFGFKQQIP